MTLPSVTDPALPVPHGFFTRDGGVSTGPYASLNCSLSGGDDRALVLVNRSRVAQALGAAPENFVGLTQVHGIEVATVTTPWAPGEGPRADAMVTGTPGIALGVITADCGPILFADPVTRIVGAAHAGWRGAVAGILEATIDAMVAIGADRSRIAAVVGPCIRQNSYEVAADMRNAVLAHDAANARFFQPGRPERWMFDLAGYCAGRLTQAGVGLIAITPGDTAAEADRFFSHRRRTLAGGGSIGHQISGIRCDA
ncbi:peptidoglycan editing factor PgeF [Acidisoma silvae]|uniref:Purine nucleoside phosphorylase n=1 Tax=Acidisoma silvae TaxID=2802396 RepID=A0A964DZL7_9PROT|nr:peptidoglycan editing factor PgeF [Acidisoma silvae]MCB8876257.1 peptidoglycan editing factor PgeF [Acidisoma silvae]